MVENVENTPTLHGEPEQVFVGVFLNWWLCFSFWTDGSDDKVVYIKWLV